jgi:XapX domain-containing protein
MEMKVLFLSFVVGLGVGVLYGLIRVKSPAPPIVARLGLLGMVIGEQLGVWIQTKKLDIPRATAVCLVGERYDRRQNSQIDRCADLDGAYLPVAPDLLDKSDYWRRHG